MSRRQKMEMRKSLEVRSKGERGFNKIYWAKNMFRWRKIYECKQARQNVRMTKSPKVRIGRRGLLGGFNKVFWAPPISNPLDSNTNSILSSSFSTLSDFIPCFGRLKKLFNFSIISIRSIEYPYYLIHGISIPPPCYHPIGIGLLSDIRQSIEIIIFHFQIIFFDDAVIPFLTASLKIRWWRWKWGWGRWWEQLR